MEISHDRLVFVRTNVVARRSIPASSVVVGDELFTSDGAAKVTKIARITRRGAFAPFTGSGTLVVNGVGHVKLHPSTGHA